jgi:transposase
MVMGASNFTFAEASYSQRLGDFVASTMRGLEYFGAVPEVLVPDQLRSAVTGPDRYDPEINATYADMAEHYGMAVVPARPRKPRDKSKVEAAVLIVQRWIVACLRNHRFETLEQLNQAIADLLEQLNDRPFRKMEGTRRSLFELLDRPAMRPLPVYRYELAIRKNATVNIDYHVAYDDRLYSVPYALVQAKVVIRATTTLVEVHYQGRRVASHVRSYGPKGSFLTQEEHRPQNHKERGKWGPERLISWAASYGPSVAKVVELTLARNHHPEMGYRSCLGLIRCADRYGAKRMDLACAKALTVAGTMGPKRTFIEAILKGGLEQSEQDDTEPATRLPRHHEHLRGAQYFSQQDLHHEH